MSPPIRVAVADDSLLIRSALRELLGTVDDVLLVAECADGDELLAAIGRTAPDVVITDIRMPPGGDGEGIRIANLLRESSPSIGVIVLSQYEEPSFGRELLAKEAAGRGYLLKAGVHERDQLTASIRVVASGGTVIDPSMVRRLLADETRRDDRLADLTPRELEVLAMMAEGRSNATIAHALVLTKRAIEKHIGSIFSKLGLTEEEIVSRRVAAVLLFLEGTRQGR